MSVLPPLGRRVHRLLRGHYSSVIAPTDSFANPVWLFFPSALASCKKSAQVATSPCCHRDLPDVISANLSSDAWSPATAVPRSAYTCFFLRVIGLPPERSGSASRFSPRIRLLAGGVFEAADISLCSGLRVCSSPRSFLPLHKVLQGSRDFYIRAERASLPLHAPDMLAVRIPAIDGTRTSTLLDSQPCRPLPSPSPHPARPGSRELPVDPYLRSPLGLPVLPLVPYVCMPSPLPRQVRGNGFAQYCSIDCGLPQITVGSAPALSVSWPAQRSLTLRPTDSPSRLMRPSTPEAPTALLSPPPLRLLPGGAIQFPGGPFIPLWTSAFHGAL
jgi:hypothetical protein